MVNIQIYKHWEIKEKNGKVRKTRRLKCHSFVKNWALLIEYRISHSYGNTSASITMTDTGGTSRTDASQGQNGVYVTAAAAPANDATYGMQVGTGTDAPTITDTKLQTQITHGTGASQLSHGATVVSTVRVEGSNAKLLIQRQFTNNSGGSITVRESGLAVKEYNAWYFLIIREAENQAIANASTGTLYYDMVFTV